jgi:chemotaxis family two-component system response regulator Rcp1
MTDLPQPANELVVRILLAEDNDGDIFLVRRALEKRGVPHQLTVARNGEEALELLERAESSRDSEAPGLILLDLNLPKIDGAQVLSRIRKTTAFSTTPVIVLTSSDSPRDRESALALGANVYFRKPTDLQSFMYLGEVIERLLRDRATLEARR